MKLLSTWIWNWKITRTVMICLDQMMISLTNLLSLKTVHVKTPSKASWNSKKSTPESTLKAPKLPTQVKKSTKLLLQSFTICESPMTVPLLENSSCTQVPNSTNPNLWFLLKHLLRARFHTTGKVRKRWSTIELGKQEVSISLEKLFLMQRISLNSSMIIPEMDLPFGIIKVMRGGLIEKVSQEDWILWEWEMDKCTVWQDVSLSIKSLS